MKRWISIVSAMTMVVGTARADAPAPRTASFNIGGVGYTMPLPTGFCLPTGQLIALAQTVAAADSSNVTNLTVYRCNATPLNLGDYVLIKTPNNLISINVDHAMFAAHVAPEFDKPFPISDDKISSDVADGYDRVTGKRPKIGIKLATHGHDDICGYMSGSGTVGQGDTTKPIMMGACMTAIGGRVIQVIRYTESSSPADEQRMMREARATALTIKATGKR